jgi:hypothetical protein
VRTFFRFLEGELGAMAPERRAEVIELLRGMLRGLAGFKRALPGIPWKATMALIKDLTLEMGLGKKGPAVLEKAKKIAHEVGPHVEELLHAI